MGRRFFLSLVAIAFAFLPGCRRRREPDRAWHEEPPAVEPVDRIAGKLQLALSGDGRSFDPITIYLLSTVLCSIVRYCVAEIAARIQQRVQRNPSGRTAKNLRAKIRNHYANAKSEDDLPVFANDADVDKHVDATMDALKSATPEEFQQLVADVHRQSTTGSTINLFSVRTAQDWSSLE